MMIDFNFCLLRLIRYDGTPLQLDDERLGEIAKWIKHHDLSVVKLDCLMHKVNLWLQTKGLSNLYFVILSNNWEL